MLDELLPCHLSDQSMIRAAKRGLLEPLAHRAGLSLQGKSWTSFLALALKLHRQGLIDLVAAATVGDRPLGYFAGRLYADALPELDLDASTMASVVAALTVRSYDGTTPSFVHEAFRMWASKSAARVEGALAALRSRSVPASLKTAALQAGLCAQRSTYLPVIADLLKGGCGEEVEAAGIVIGQVDFEDASESALVAAAVTEAMIADDAARRLAGFKAALSIGMRVGQDEMLALRAVAAAQAQNSPELRLAAANALLIARDRPSDALVGRVCNMLHETRPVETNTINVIDHLISQHITGPTSEPRIILLTELLNRGVVDLVGLAGTAYHILAAGDELIGKLADDWTKDGSDELILAMIDLIELAGVSQSDLVNWNFTSAASAPDSALASSKIRPMAVRQPDEVAAILLGLKRSDHPETTGARLIDL